MAMPTALERERAWLNLLDAVYATARRGAEAAHEQALAELVRASSAEAIPRLVEGLSDPNPAILEATARAAEAILRAAPRRSWWALDRSLRGRHLSPLPLARVHALTQLERGRLGALALAAMQRDGWTRAAALDAIADDRDALRICVSLVRLNDPVDAIAQTAERGLLDRLAAFPLAALVTALPLVDSMAGTVRAGRSGVARAIDARLDELERRARAALSRAATAPDPDVRISSLSRLVAAHSDAPAIALAFDDSNPRVRRALAELVARAPLPPATAERLLPRLERDRSSAIRLLGLRWRRRRGEAAPILRACFDRNANVRHYARRYYRSFAAVDYRELALARLDSSVADELVGALATLSDVGHQLDRPLVEPFTRHRIRRVADEAQRTLALLDYDRS